MVCWEWNAVVGGHSRVQERKQEKSLQTGRLRELEAHEHGHGMVNVNLSHKIKKGERIESHSRIAQKLQLQTTQ